MVAFDKELVGEAAAIAKRAVLEGPLQTLTRGVPCPTCAGEQGFARLTDAEVGSITKHATSTVFRLLWLRENEPDRYRRELHTSDDICAGS
jgi:hypothetical protein